MTNCRENQIKCSTLWKSNNNVDDIMYVREKNEIHTIEKNDDKNKGEI